MTVVRFVLPRRVWRRTVFPEPGGPKRTTESLGTRFVARDRDEVDPALLRRVDRRVVIMKRRMIVRSNVIEASGMEVISVSIRDISFDIGGGRRVVINTRRVDKVFSIVN